MTSTASPASRLVSSAPQRSTTRDGLVFPPVQGDIDLSTPDGRYLLSGVVRCAVLNVPAGQRCGKVSVSGPRLADLVSQLVRRYLAERDLQREAEPWPREAERLGATTRIRELMDQVRIRSNFRRGSLPSRSWKPRLTGCVRSGWPGCARRICQEPATKLDHAWPQMDTDQRRAVIQSVFHAVVVKSAASRGGRFDPSRAGPVWR